MKRSFYSDLLLETGRGLKATRDIEAGTRLILVGSRYCFTARTARLFRPEIPSHLLKKPLECLTMFLMLEDQLGVHSSVAPYVHSLPRTFTNPLSLFEGTRFRIPDGVCSELDALLRKQRDEMILGWKSVSAAFRDLDEKTRTASCTPKNFCWAWFAVATRTLYVNPKEPALVPFLDLFNHSPIAKVLTLTCLLHFCLATLCFKQVFSSD
jgi:SET domain